MLLIKSVVHEKNRDTWVIQRHACAELNQRGKRHYAVSRGKHTTLQFFRGQCVSNISQ